jgi:hypothetical protein
MPLRITLECPLDGTTLTTNAPLQVRGQATATHVHLALPNAPMTCAQGHRWRIDAADTIQLLREA